MFTLENKSALVTGAGSGIGAAIASTFAQAKAFVYVTDRDEKGGQTTTARLKADSAEADFIRLDVSREDDCARAAERVHQQHGRLDILVNNAGIGHVGTMLQTAGEDLDRLYAVNVRGVFNMTRAFLPQMIARKKGVVIN